MQVFYSDSDLPFIYVTNKPIRVSVTGLTDLNLITFNTVTFKGDQTYKAVNCCLSSEMSVYIDTIQPYIIGECKPSLTSKRSSIIIKQSGIYQFDLSQVDTSVAFSVSVEALEEADISNQSLGIEPCGVCLDLEWTTTGAKRCNEHLQEREEISECGTIRWVKTGKRCGYVADLPIVLYPHTESCCSSGITGYIYSPYGERDPDATAEITDCEYGLVGYAYPTSDEGHTLPISDCDGTIYGWAVNSQKQDLKTEFKEC